jgi:predicted peptidase
MRKLTLYLTAISLLALAGTGTAQPAAGTDAKTMQTPKQFHFQKTHQAELNYLLFLPKGYDAQASKKWPLMLFLHGAGERGNDIWKVAVHGPPKNIARNPEFPFILVSPQCAEGQIWSNDVLLGLLDEVSRNHAVDASRVYLTGLSMGGYGTWSLGLSYPERFAAIAPICGGGELITVLLSSGEKAEALKSLGVWAFHGAKDTVVPVDESQRMVNFLKKVGVSEVKLTVYPEANHDSWTETYNNPEFYSWLLKHERKVR